MAVRPAVELVALAPTLLQLLGIEAGSARFDGESLLRGSRRSGIARRAWRVLRILSQRGDAAGVARGRLDARLRSRSGLGPALSLPTATPASSSTSSVMSPRPHAIARVTRQAGVASLTAWHARAVTGVAGAVAQERQAKTASRFPTAGTSKRSRLGRRTLVDPPLVAEACGGAGRSAAGSLVRSHDPGSTRARLRRTAEARR